MHLSLAKAPPLRVAHRGTVRCTRCTTEPAVCSDTTDPAWNSAPADLTNAVQIAAGESHTCALRNDGSVRCWGCSHNGQADVPAGLAGVKALRAGAYSTLAITNAGVRVWGTSYPSEDDPTGGLPSALIPPPNLKLDDVVAVGTGGRAACATR